MPVVLAAIPAEVFIAAALLLLLWAVQALLVKPLVTLLEHVPLIGGTVAGAINDVVSTVIGWAQDWVKWGVDAIVQIVHIPIKAIGDFVAMVGSFSEYAAAAIIRVGQVAAGQIGQVADALTSLVKRVGALASQLAQAIANISTLFAKVAAIIATAIPSAIAAARTAILAVVNHLLDALESTLRAVISATRAAIMVAVEGLLAPIKALLALVPAWIAQAVAVAVHPLQLGLEALGNAFGQAINAILARLALLEKLLPLLSLIPLVGAIPIAIETFWRTKQQCVDPTCNLLGPLLDGLGEAGELLTGSVLIYLVTESISDPQGAATEVAGWGDELRGLASGVTQVLAGRSI